MMVYLKSGAVRNYRIIPSMAKTGFIFSPLIENSVDFSSLFLDPKILAPNEVESFAIYPENKAWAWKQAYQIQFSEFNFPLKSHKEGVKWEFLRDIKYFRYVIFGPGNKVRLK